MNVCDFYGTRTGSILKWARGPSGRDLCPKCGEHREDCGHAPRTLNEAEERERQARLEGTNLGNWATVHLEPRPQLRLVA